MCIVLRLHIYSSPSVSLLPLGQPLSGPLRLGKRAILAAVPPDPVTHVLTVCSLLLLWAAVSHRLLVGVGNGYHMPKLF